MQYAGYRCQNSYDSWKFLEKRYASPSQKHILHSRTELFQKKGDGLSSTDFLNKINHIADNLFLAGKPVDDADLIYVIMNDVGSAYETTCLLYASPGYSDYI